MNSTKLQDLRLAHKNSYINSELSEMEGNKTVSFTIASKYNKILRNKFSQGGIRHIL